MHLARTTKTEVPEVGGCEFISQLLALDIVSLLVLVQLVVALVHGVLGLLPSW